MTPGQRYAQPFKIAIRYIWKPRLLEGVACRGHNPFCRLPLPRGRSSLFDRVTFAALFQSGWFMQSLRTQEFIMLLIRTDRTPFLQSHASIALTATTATVRAVGAWLPISVPGRLPGFTALPERYWPVEITILVGYAGDRVSGEAMARLARPA